MYKSISFWFDRFLDILTVVSGGIVLFVILTVFADVVGRYFFNAPLTWVFGLSIHLLIYFVFLAAAWVLREGGHVNIDLLEMKLKPRHRSILRFITSLLAMISCGILFWSSIKAILLSYRWGTFMVGPPMVPEYILLLSIPIGTFLLIVQFGRECMKYTRGIRGK